MVKAFSVLSIKRNITGYAYPIAIMEQSHVELMEDIQIAPAPSSKSWLSSAMSQPCRAGHSSRNENNSIRNGTIQECVFHEDNDGCGGNKQRSKEGSEPCTFMAISMTKDSGENDIETASESSYSDNDHAISAADDISSSAYYHTDEDGSNNESIDLEHEAEMSLAQSIDPFLQEGPDFGLTSYADENEPCATDMMPTYYRDEDEVNYEHASIFPTSADLTLHTIIENSGGERDRPSDFPIDPFLKGGVSSKTTSSNDNHELRSNTIPTYYQENVGHVTEQELTPSHIDLALHTIIEYASREHDPPSALASSDSKISTSEAFPESSQIGRKLEEEKMNQILIQKNSEEHVEAALRSIASFCNREEVLAKIVRQYKEGQKSIKHHPKNNDTSSRKKGAINHHPKNNDTSSRKKGAISRHPKNNVPSLRKKGKEKKKTLISDIPTSITVPKSSVPKRALSVSERTGCRLYEQALLRQRRLDLKAREASSLQHGVSPLSRATSKSYRRKIASRSCRASFSSSKASKKVRSPSFRRKMQESSDINEHMTTASIRPDIISPSKCLENDVFDRLYHTQKNDEKRNKQDANEKDRPPLRFRPSEKLKLPRQRKAQTSSRQPNSAIKGTDSKFDDLYAKIIKFYFTADKIQCVDMKIKNMIKAVHNIHKIEKKMASTHASMKYESRFRNAIEETCNHIAI